MRCVLITFLGSVVLTAVSPMELPSQVLPLKTPNSQTKTENVKEIRVQKKWRTEDPEIEMNATQLITSKGFPCENYYVATDDGYILNIIRIPHGQNNRNMQGSRPVVFLQHGLLSSCTDFLVNPVNESLAYILAEAGADVWLGNSRGNSYSYQHKTLNPKEREFWQFSFDEMAKYDVPAVINFILSNTGVDQVFYVGHSQGTTIGFIAFGENQELASHIKHFIALAPIARVGYIKSPLRFIAPLAKEIEDFFRLFGHGEVSADLSVSRFLAKTLCNEWGSVMCGNLLFLFSGFNSKSVNMSRVPVYIGHIPSSTSVRDILHWAQCVNSNSFQKYDYGSAKQNIKHYGQATPPLYDPRKVKVPVAIFRGGKDLLADPEDVKWLLPQLRVTVDINIDYYEHIDFIWAADASTVIYNKILRIIFS